MQPTPEKVFKLFRENYREIPLHPVSKTPFQLLTAVMLSARTRDETVARVCTKLFEIAPDAKQISSLSEEKLTDLLKPIGFYKTKAKNLKVLSQILVNKHNGNVPNTVEALTELPGVGRKTANIILARCFKIPAIGVDTHLHRIANTLGWVNTKNPPETEKELMKILPKKYWVEINDLFVSIGQQYRSMNQLKKFLKDNGLIS